MNIFEKLKKAQQDHEARHRPTGLGLVLSDSIRYVNAEEWDKLVEGKSYLLSREYLSVLESDGPKNLEPRYGIIYRNEPVPAHSGAGTAPFGGSALRSAQRPVACFRAQFVKVVGEQIGKNKALAILRERILMAGDLLSAGFNGAAFAEGEDPSELWPAILEGLYRLRRGEKLSGQVNLVILKDFDGDEKQKAVLKQFDYRPFATEPNMVLTISPSWKSFDDYLASLTARYRRNVKDIFEKVKKAGYEVEILEDVASQSGRIHELYLQVLSNAEFKFFSLPENFLPALAQTARDKFHCIVVRKGTDLAGFVTLLKDGDTMIGFFIGFDRKLNAEVPLYFRLLYALIENTIASGCSRLSLGRTALEPKANLGAKPVPTSVWLRHRIPAVNLAVREIFGKVTHKNPPERNPFK